MGVSLIPDVWLFLLVVTSCLLYSFNHLVLYRLYSTIYKRDGYKNGGNSHHPSITYRRDDSRSLSREVIDVKKKERDRTELGDYGG